MSQFRKVGSLRFYVKTRSAKKDEWPSRHTLEQIKQITLHVTLKQLIENFKNLIQAVLLFVCFK